MDISIPLCINFVPIRANALWFIFRYQILIRGRERVKLRDAVARAALGKTYAGVEVIVDVVGWFG